MNTDPELTRVLDLIEAGDRLSVVRRNRGTWYSTVSGSALAAPSVSPAIGIDLFDGDPHIVRSAEGDVYGEIRSVWVHRSGGTVAYYRHPEEEK